MNSQASKNGLSRVEKELASAKEKLKEVKNENQRLKRITEELQNQQKESAATR